MWQFIKYEWKHWLRSPMLWILLLVNTLLVFGAVSSDNISIGGGVGSIHKNAPYTVQMYYGVMSLVCLLMTTAFMNATAIRDFQYKTYQLVFSKPIKKESYFFGKFLGAVSMAVIPLLGVSLGALIGPYMPWAQPERYGSVTVDGHIWGIVAFAIPNVFITGVLLYSLALIFRNSIVSFIGSMGILVLYGLSQGFASDIQNEGLANMLDPFGFQPLSYLSKYMTVDEKNNHAVPLMGPFLWNRLLWMGVSLVLLLVLFFRFSFSSGASGWRKASKKVSHIESWEPTQRDFQPNAAARFSLAAFSRLLLFEVKSIISNPTFIILTIIGAINLTVSLTSFTSQYGEKQYPVTYDVIGAIEGSFYLFLIGAITFYSGVLVWKERDAQIQDITDATPVKNGLLFSSKMLAMILAVAIILASTIVVGVIAQLCYGYTRLQLDVYLWRIMVLDLLNFSYLIVIALLFHYIINNRYIAYFAFVVFVILNTFVWSALKIASNMPQYGSVPRLIYSDMNGFGPFVPGLIGFHVYWFLFAFLVALVVFSFFIRGRETDFRQRLATAGATMRRNSALIVCAAIAFIACSGFVYYNTEILNTYDGQEALERMQVDYENKYKKYERMPQPRWTAFDYEIDIEPYRRNLYVHTRAILCNRTDKPIHQLIFSTPYSMDSMQIQVPGGQWTLQDHRLHFFILKLKSPLLPGDSTVVSIRCKKETKGFENEVSFTQLTQNGTFFNHSDIIPILGYARDYEIADKNDRRKYKLPVRRRLPVLQESDSVARANCYISSDADWVRVHTIMSTASDQTAIAPGSLVRTWRQGDKQYFEYQLDHSSLNFYSFISARYKVAREQWNGIALEVYYHPDHAYNVPTMLSAVRKSLAYYTEHFGPYFHKQARILEFPRYAGFAQAFPGTMPYSEGIGFITDLRNVTKDDIDFVFYVVAHEMGHQYWAHQLCGAAMQGSELMSEGFAQYSALMVMEKEYGKDKMKQFLEYEMDGYLRGRSNEFVAERPLIRTEGQQYIHYQKASVALYYLKEMIGEDRMNSALRSLLDSFAYKEPPYATSMSALRAFKAATPDSLQYLISDMFENITLFSNRVAKARARQVGKEYEVIVTTVSEKFRADTLGKESPTAINDYIDVGVFEAPKGKAKVGRPLLMRRVHFRKKDNTFTFRVKQKPDWVGIDPYNFLIDRIPNDNLKKVD